MNLYQIFWLVFFVLLLISAANPYAKQLVVSYIIGGVAGLSAFLGWIVFQNENMLMSGDLVIYKVIMAVVAGAFAVMSLKLIVDLLKGHFQKK